MAALRPVYYVSNKKGSYIIERNVEFQWNAGITLVQKKKNVIALHNAAKEIGVFPILEISTASENNFGKQASAFNLSIKIKNKKIPIESAYQGSKKFDSGGPYIDIYNMSGHNAKKDIRLQNSGRLLEFDFAGSVWPLEPKNMFYDWLYISALVQNMKLGKNLLAYKGFTDISFNPKKSINCQARAAALFVALYSRGILMNVIQNKKYFEEIEMDIQKTYNHPQKDKNKQKALFC